MDYTGKCRGRSDDSCGWHSPHLLKSEKEGWERHAESQYEQLFRKTKMTNEGESWAYVCYEVPDCYTAIYWIWRALKHEHLKKKWWYRQPWQYGNAPTAGELETIMSLASNPVDNLQFSFTSEAPRPPGSADRQGDDFLSFYFCVLRCYRRYHRPWWRHPRWHVHHWRLQIHPWQTLRRWLLTRCSKCGKRFAWGESPVTGCWDAPRLRWFKGEEHLYHSDCSHNGGPVEMDRAAEDAVVNAFKSQTASQIADVINKTGA